MRKGHRSRSASSGESRARPRDLWSARSCASSLPARHGRGTPRGTPRQRAGERLRARRTFRSRVARFVGGPVHGHGGRRLSGARRRDRTLTSRGAAGAGWRTSHRLGATSGAWRLRPPWHFDLDSATRALTEQFHTRDLAGFGCADKPLAVAAAGALLSYVRETQKAALPHLRSLVTEERDGSLIMDPATRRNLELDESLAGKPELTLAGVFDRTATAMGGRMLRRWLHRPLRDRTVLRARYQAVATLMDGSRHSAIAELAAQDRRSRAHSGAHRSALRASARSRALARRARRDAVSARNIGRLRAAGSFAAARAAAGGLGDHRTDHALLAAPSSSRRRISCATAA